MRRSAGLLQDTRFTLADQASIQTLHIAIAYVKVTHGTLDHLVTQMSPLSLFEAENFPVARHWNRLQSSV